MKALKVKVKGADHPSIMEDRRMQSACTRCAYNDFAKRKLDSGESYTRCSGLFRRLGSRLVNAAVRQGEWTFKSVKAVRKAVEKSKDDRKKKEKKKAAAIEKAARKEGKRANGYAVLWKRRKKALKKCNAHLKEGEKPKPIAKKKSKRKDWQPYFGDYQRRRKGLISREEYKESRLLPLLSEGEKDRKGNRHLKLDIENGRFIYKRRKGEHILLEIVEDLPEWKFNELKKLEELAENSEIPITFTITNDEIVLTFNDAYVYRDVKEEEKKELNPNRVMGLDLNPDYIGVPSLKERPTTSLGF